MDGMRSAGLRGPKRPPAKRDVVTEALVVAANALTDVANTDGLTDSESDAIVRAWNDVFSLVAWRLGSPDAARKVIASPEESA